MKILETLLWFVVALISFPGILVLLYLWIFSGPGVLDGLPDPADKNEGDL